MPNFIYTRDIPDAAHNPSTDQPDMKINTDSIDDLIQVDHYSFNDNNGGFHKQSTYVAQADPTTGVLQGATYTKNVGAGVTQLFYRRESNGTVIRLTGDTSAGFNGYTFLPGGIIIQWGFQNGTHSGVNHTFNPGDTGTTSFPITFPNQIFNVTTNVNFNSNTAGAPSASSALIIAPDYFNTNTSGFSWKAGGSGGSYTVFYWFAIGN